MSKAVPSKPYKEIFFFQGIPSNEQKETMKEWKRKNRGQLPSSVENIPFFPFAIEVSKTS